MEKLVLPLIKKAPHLLVIEGQDGKTPFDLAIDKHLQEILQGFLSTHVRVKRWPTPISVIHWPLFAFGTGYSGAFYERDPYEAWEICQSMMNSASPAQSTRRLITRAELDEITLLYV